MYGRYILLIVAAILRTIDCIPLSLLVSLLLNGGLLGVWLNFSYSYK